MAVHANRPDALVTPDLRKHLESSLGQSYTIEHELGGGGMSRVFVATERALGRRVVIKVLDDEAAAGVSARRFAREIRLAASLQHANIVPVLSAGDSEGVAHYTMPFVDGLSLRDRLASDGALPLADIVTILRDVARAMAYAHERGVMHRDIKPANVLLSGGAAVVTDFGIAKALAAAREGDLGDAHATASTVTRAGTAVGTPAYMAPEQIAGDPGTDHRADLYAFGCLAYELLAGTPPYHGRPMAAVLAAHLMESPTPIGERRPDTPPTLARLIMQCLAKEPAERPQSAAEVLATLEDPGAPARGVTRWRQQLSRRQRTLLFLAALLPLFAAALFTRQRWAGTPPDVSVAVVPFVNVTGDTSQEYLVAGVADGLTTALGRVEGIRVVSRSIAGRYRTQRNLDARELGRELGVSHVVHGSWRTEQGILRVQAQLVSARDNSELWSHGFERPATDVLGVENEIRHAVIAALGARAGMTIADEQPAAAETNNREAHDLVLRGRFLLQRRGPGVRQATENFERAIALDGAYARAHASLALALQLLPYFENVSPRSVRDRTIAAATRALELDPQLAEAHTALAMASQHDYDWPAAEVSYRRALSLERGDPDTHIQYGRFLYYTGRFSAAMAQFRRASELDPHSAVASGWVGHLLDLSGRTEEGLSWIQRALEIDSTSPPVLVFAAQAARTLGRRDESRAYTDRLWRTVPNWRAPAASANRDDTTRIQEHITALLSAQPPSATLNTRMAVLRLALADTAGALDYLEKATAAREPWPSYYSMSERQFDVLRENPRFASLLRSVGLDVRTFTSPTGGRPP